LERCFLPAASSFEKDGTFMNAERRVQRVRRAIPAVGSSLPDWEIVCRVARAMVHQTGFEFNSAEEIWHEIRGIWPKGAGISYSRLDREAGLQWPCAAEDDPGQTFLHGTAFAHGERAPFRCIEFRPAPEVRSECFPYLLMTGRNLYHFNAGTMTMRTPNEQLRAADSIDIAPIDAERLGLRDGEMVAVASCHGEAKLPAYVDTRVREGCLYATFHSTAEWVNRVTGPARDNRTGTPEYKVTAVRIACA
jgi:formate dehydrogenase major subunit